MLQVEMNNLRAAYDAHEKEFNEEIIKCARSGKYIMGKEVEFFSDSLKYIVFLHNIHKYFS